MARRPWRGQNDRACKRRPLSIRISSWHVVCHGLESTENESGIETSMNHDVQTVRSFDHPGEGRKRAKSTPKGRQIDPQAAEEIALLLGRPAAAARPADRASAPHPGQIPADFRGASGGAGRRDEARLRRGVRDRDLLRAFRRGEGGRARHRAADHPGLRFPDLRHAGRGKTAAGIAGVGRPRHSRGARALRRAVRRGPGGGGRPSLRDARDRVRRAGDGRARRDQAGDSALCRLRRLCEGRRLQAAERSARRSRQQGRRVEGARRCQPARARRRRLSHRAQVARGARRARAAADGHQWRRGRARHVQGPLLSAARPASLPGRHADRRPCRRCDRRLHLHPRRISGRARGAAAGARQAAGGRSDPAHPPRRRRLYLRRGILAARKHRGQARPAAPQAALSVPGRAVRPADADQQHRDAVLGARHRREGRGLVEFARPQRPPWSCAATRCRAGSGIPA